ncbi:aminopeptidase [Salipiger abyssi]|uniref:Leucyl aminopeptidase (Aminopeptidase T) n=1 Tax=Salipiger abyssi TaxID=1250539 RepID=A0A1P8UN39_9RHOB|nr:aminopeptidase [Salipiger abyssi]APZ50793.1 leucyl aminopeptidase (aminopeptidase T) [Salipiger abyssi]
MAERSDLVEVLKTPLRLNAKAGDRIYIITDTAMEEPVWRGLHDAALALEMQPTVALMQPRATHSTDPESAVRSGAMDASNDLVVYLTSTAMAHAPITDALLEEGRRFILMEELTARMLDPDGPAGADYFEIDKLGQKLAKIFTEGSEVRVTCPNGTDLLARIDGRPGRSISGIPLVMHESGGGGCAFPDGECHVCPVEGTGQGVIVFDLTAHNVGAIKTPIRVTVENGMATAIEGGEEAEIWRKLLREHGDANSFNCPAEISIGLNPKVTPMGSMRTDKKMYATSHIGLGDTIALGGTCKSKLRIEGVIRQPCISVDGTELTRGGKILIG